MFEGLAKRLLGLRSASDRIPGRACRLIRSGRHGSSIGGQITYLHGSVIDPTLQHVARESTLLGYDSAKPRPNRAIE
jgi:hypothetical protein